MPGLLYPLIYGTKYNANDVPDLSGKIIIVTGANTGIGFQTTIALVRAGAKVYMGARTESKAKEAIAQINGMNLKGSVIWLKLDLMSFASTRAAAEEFSKKEKVLDVLFNSAGISGPSEHTVDADGLESTIKTNHFAPFLFTHLLLPKLQKAAEPRIVMTSSTLYKQCKSTPDHLSTVEQLNLPGTEGVSGGMARYNQSKLANLLFAMQLAKEQPNMLVNACHPGLVATDMTQNAGSQFGIVAHYVAKALFYLLANVLGMILSPPEGALTQLYLGTAPEVAKKHISGEYFAPIAQLNKKAPVANAESAQRLWQTTKAYLKAKNIALEL